MNLRHLVSLTALTGACALSLPAAATTYCVNNVSSLTAAFNSANADDEGTTHEIRVRPGTYAVSAGLIFEPAGDKDSKDFSLTGGWNSDCSARTINSSATVLNGENGSTDANFRFYGNNGRYVVEGIRVINFSDFYIDDANCNLDCPDTDLIRVRYNEFRNGNAVRIRAKDAQVLTVANNLFANLTTASGDTVRLDYVNNESPPTIAFNTVAGVACSSSGGNALYVFTQISGVTLHHNIVQQVGCSGDITIPIGSGSQPVALRNNRYSSLSGLAPSVAIGNINQPPSFVNAAGGDFHLKESAPISPAINAGMTPTQASTLGLSASIPSQDLDGPAGARQIGTRYDMGAYESSINDSSVLTVISENDSGAGSLRAQIAAANASPGLQKIEFNIAGGCTPTPHLILLSSPLPDITDSLEIDGYSEPEAAANTLTNGSDAVLCVMVGAQGGTLAQALQVPDAAATATSLTLRGIAFIGTTGFNGNFTVALRLRGGSNHLIQGNAFAGIGPGTVGSLGTLNFGLQIRDSAQNVLVGGADPEHRNSFGAMDSSAIVLNDATSGGHTIQNNYIGLSANGQSASAIGLNGIFASASPDIEILDNVISSVGSSAAISITGASATGYTIQRNRLGVTAFGIPTVALRNGTGIRFDNGSGDHQIGSVLGLALSNLITNSDGAGVWITPTAGTGILVRPNKIFANGAGGVGMGIDIGVLGQSANDPLDPDLGPNNSQNWPQVTTSLPNPDGSREVTVTLDSKPSTSFRIDIYRSPDCPGGNRGGNMLNRVGTVTTTTNAAGATSATFSISGVGAPGLLTATATNLATNDSSEPGLCSIEPNATTTTITNDSPDPSQVGQAYTVTVLVSSVVGTPSGSVTISDGQGNQCTDTTLSGGIGSCQMVSTSLGNKTLTANYLGSFTHAPSSDTESHTVVAAVTTTTIVSDQPDPSEVGQPYTVSVQVRTQNGNTLTPGGQIAVSDGSGQTCQIAALSAGNGSCQLTSVSVGNKTLTATYTPSSQAFAGSNDTEAHNVALAATTTNITSDAPDPSSVGQAYLVQVSVTSQAGTPTGAVAINDGAGASCNANLSNGVALCQLTSTIAGPKTLTATYVGNASYLGSSDTEAHTVSPSQAAATITLITADTPEPSVPGQPYMVSVTVSSQGGTPTGTVTVNDGAGAGASNCQINLESGSGSCQLTSNFAGGRVLTACMQANANWAGSCDTEEHQIIKADTNLAFTSFAPNPANEGQPTQVSIALSVAAPGAGTPTGVLTVSASATEQCTITLPASSCALTLTSPGNRAISVNYPGDANFNGSSRQTTLTVQPDQLLRNGFEN